MVFAKPFAEGLIRDSIGLTEGLYTDAFWGALGFVEKPEFLKIAAAVHIIYIKNSTKVQKGQIMGNMQKLDVYHQYIENLRIILQKGQIMGNMLKLDVYVCLCRKEKYS